MQWNKVKTMIIILLAAVDLFLAGFAGVKFIKSDMNEKAAFSSALDIAESRGWDRSAFDQLPKSSYVWSVSRDTSLEKKAALAVLGKNAGVSDMGSGIYFYESTLGTAMFRSGGYFEMRLFEKEPEDPLKAVTAILKKAGIKPAGYSQEDGAFYFEFGGSRVNGAYLSFEWGESLYISGRVYLAAPKKAERSASRAETVIRAAADAPAEAEFIYRFDGETLSPAFKISYPAD